MFRLDLHRSVMMGVLVAFYQHPLLRTLLGFKGGTAAMLFYNLPRFSVDLDFDLLDVTKNELVLEEMRKILAKEGRVVEVQEKRLTLFGLLDYGKEERNLKVEIFKRPTPSQFEAQNYLGQTMMVMSAPDMMACKLAALATRKKFASRDMYDMWYFLSEHWEMNNGLVRVKSELDWKQAIKQAIARVERLKTVDMLQGLGELLDEKQKMWVRNNLQKELLLLLKIKADLRE